MWAVVEQPALRRRLAVGGRVIDNLEDFDVPERRPEQAQDREQFRIHLWHTAMVLRNGRLHTAALDIGLFAEEAARRRLRA
jgi:hypothetical protein